MNGIQVNITIYSEDEDEDNHIDIFTFPQAPRVDETIYISYATRLHPSAQKHWSDEALAHAKRFDGTRWTVTAVCWNAAIDNDSYCIVYVRQALDL